MEVSWDISTEADSAARGALSAGLGKPALRFGATVKEGRHCNDCKAD